MPGTQPDPPAPALVPFATQIPLALKREVKVRAAQTGESVQAFTARALRRELDRREEAPS